MSKARSFIQYWLLPLAWMSMIFLVSSDKQSLQHSSRIIAPLLRWVFPQISEHTVDVVVYDVRKCAHLTEYALLAWLLWRAIRKPKRYDPRPWSWREGIVAVLIVALYAATDEFHQSFVPGRTPLVSDVLIDTIGAVFGMLLLWRVGHWFKWWPKTEIPKSDEPA
jgi:VanZ family protein